MSWSKEPIKTGSLPHRQLRNSFFSLACFQLLFTAAQAAQKVIVDELHTVTKFTAAQAAQKGYRIPALLAGLFTATQAAQKKEMQMKQLKTLFTAAQAAQKSRSHSF